MGTTRLDSSSNLIEHQSVKIGESVDNKVCTEEKEYLIRIFDV